LARPCPVPGRSAYEPNSIDGEYAQQFRHIQYKRTPSLRHRDLGNAFVPTHRQVRVSTSPVQIVPRRSLRASTSKKRNTSCLAC
jgi:hypothetical protein